jgi:exodeoxyribonuclease-5
MSSAHIQLTAEQEAIAAQIHDFLGRRLRPGEKPWYCYQGLAGTGKSVLLAHIANCYPDAILCAFTGKAASVISRKSGLPAQTIHSLLYSFKGRDKLTDEPRYARKVPPGAWAGGIVLVDECSTISTYLAKDLLETGVRVIACGDNGQLAPVKGQAFFTQPDAMLTEVHRQAWDSAIIRQAHAVRAGFNYQNDGYDFQVTREIDRETMLGADVVLCYRNETRANLNNLLRAQRGLSAFGMAGEPVMALRNVPSLGLLNGATYQLAKNHFMGSGVVSIINEAGDTIDIQDAYIEDFGPPIIARSDAEEDRPNNFAWAYACTVHKAQGSEWERVILVDEYDRQHQRLEFLYTGITRASKQIIVRREY